MRLLMVWLAALLLAGVSGEAGGSQRQLCPNRSAVASLTAGYKRARASEGFFPGRRLDVLPHETGLPPPRLEGAALGWPNSTAGVHSWLVFDYHVSPANATARAPGIDFVWGSSPAHAPAWRKGSPDIIVSRYINGNRDSTRNDGNLSWWRLNHPEWVMWTCKNSSGQRSVAWSDGDVDMPLDWANPALIEYQHAQYTCGCYVCPCAAGDPGGYNAIAVDGYHFANFGHACGHYDRDWTDPNAQFIMQYKTDGPAGGRWGDPRYTQAAQTWLQRFYAGLQAMTAADRPLLILNFDLAFCKEGGCTSDDPMVLFTGNHSDGVIDEGAYTWNQAGGELRPENQPAWLWEETLRWATNQQVHRKGYYPIVESLNCSSPMQSAVAEDDSTLSERYWHWYLASYLLAKGSSSALYISPVFADAPADRQHTVTMTYGQLPWYQLRFLAASSVGSPAGPLVWVSAGPANNRTVATRVYTRGFVVANPLPLGTPPVKIALPAGKRYRVVGGSAQQQEQPGVHAPVEGHVLVLARNATVLQLLD